MRNFILRDNNPYYGKIHSPAIILIVSHRLFSFNILKGLISVKCEFSIRNIKVVFLKGPELLFVHFCIHYLNFFIYRGSNIVVKEGKALIFIFRRRFNLWHFFDWSVCNFKNILFIKIFIKFKFDCWATLVNHSDKNWLANLSKTICCMVFFIIFRYVIEEIDNSFFHIRLKNGI